MRLFLGMLLICTATCGFAQQDQTAPTPTPAAEAGQPASGDPQSPKEAPPPAAATTSSLPDAPSHTATHPATDASKQQPKRILGVMPNFRAVSPGATPPPPTFKQSLKIATQNSFDYSSFIFVGITSAIAYGNRRPPATGLGRRALIGLITGAALWIRRTATTG